MSDPAGREGPGRHSGTPVSVPGEGWRGVRHLRAETRQIWHHRVGRVGSRGLGLSFRNRVGVEVPFSTTLTHEMNEESG